MRWFKPNPPATKCLLGFFLFLSSSYFIFKKWGFLERIEEVNAGFCHLFSTHHRCLWLNLKWFLFWTKNTVQVNPLSILIRFWKYWTIICRFHVLFSTKFWFLQVFGFNGSIVQRLLSNIDALLLLNAPSLSIVSQIFLSLSIYIEFTILVFHLTPFHLLALCKTLLILAVPEFQ